MWKEIKLKSAVVGVREVVMPDILCNAHSFALALLGIHFHTCTDIPSIRAYRSLMHFAKAGPSYYG